MLERIIQKRGGLDYCLDKLTGVYTRDVMVDYINELINENIPFTMGLIDVDNFKYINDNYGHSMGDQILCSTVNRIKELIDSNCTLGRFGGDEYMIVLKGITLYEHVWKILHRINYGVASLHIANLVELSITVTIGVARFPLNEKTYQGLLDIADLALYRGKTKGRNCFIIYLPEKHAHLKLSKDKNSSYSTMYLHHQVTNFLTSTFNLSIAIESLFKFLSNYLMLDHICIQTLNGIKCQQIHQLSPEKDFKYIDTEIIRKISNKSGLFYINSLNSLEYQKSELHDLLLEQNITSTCYVEIMIYGRLYGHIRVDSVLGRIWQFKDMDLLVTAAKNIALILFYQGKTLDNI